jgi:hypothetical protein
MELNEFVKETLLQIIQGVHEAQSLAKEYGATVNPCRITGNDLLQSTINNKSCTVQNVDFVVGLTSSTSEGTKLGIGVMLGSFGIGSKTNTNDNHTAATSVKFSVPIALPAEDNNNTPDRVSMGNYVHKNLY